MSVPDIPADFAEMAATTEDKYLGKHYHKSHEIIVQWRAACGVPRPPNKAHSHKRDIPEDFAAVAPTKTLSQLERHYSAGDRTIRRWLTVTGVKAKPGNVIFGPRAIVGNSRDASVAGRAAEFLQKDGAIWKASTLPIAERNHFGAGKTDFILFGRIVLSPEEVIARAEAKGFDRREWAAIPPPPTSSQEAQREA